MPMSRKWRFDITVDGKGNNWLIVRKERGSRGSMCNC